LQVDVFLRGAFRRHVRVFPKPRRREVAQAIDAVRDGFGKPHSHSGLGIRRLRGDYFECRAGLDIRLVFRTEKGRLTFVAAGDHDTVRKLLKGL
jgi:mRNA-degrading endonuclease YafQ of YafQ-DinJ toxin-antitoxin module